jgi:hypothetical protein
MKIPRGTDSPASANRLEADRSLRAIFVAYSCQRCQTMFEKCRYSRRYMSWLTFHRLKKSGADRRI